MTRTPEKADMLREMRAEPIVADALDRERVREVILRTQPEVVIHQLTDLAGMGNLKHFDRELAQTNRLRTEGTRNLLAAAREAGVRVFMAQSFSGWPNQRCGDRVKTEDDPLDIGPPASMSRTFGAIRQLEEMVAGAGSLKGVVLRYGGFYGPGTSISEGGKFVEMVRRRQFPIFGAGSGIWSFLHIDDAANATRIALEDGASGIFNIVDDEPAEVAIWLPELARAIGAKPPYHLPAWMGRLLVGEAGLSVMNSVRGSSNTKAKRALGWQPMYATWRDGFRHGLSSRPRGVPQAIGASRARTS